jgi:hypothetical protein
MTQTSVKTRRKFDEMFKREAVQNWLASGSSADLQSQLDATRRELARVREQRDILKNVGHSLRTIAERYARIDAMKLDYSVPSLCANLAVSPSGYYDWQKRRTLPGPCAVANEPCFVDCPQAIITLLLCSADKYAA